jgi:superoxide dismutase
MDFKLPELPYAPDDLEPHISGRTVDVHYHKHHAGYMAKLADEIRGERRQKTAVFSETRLRCGITAFTGTALHPTVVGAPMASLPIY